MTKDVMQQLIDSLSNIGDPLAGTTSNIQRIKSYVNCVIGRMS